MTNPSAKINTRIANTRAVQVDGAVCGVTQKAARTVNEDGGVRGSSAETSTRFANKKMPVVRTTEQRMDESVGRQ